MRAISFLTLLAPLLSLSFTFPYNGVLCRCCDQPRGLIYFSVLLNCNLYGDTSMMKYYQRVLIFLDARSFRSLVISVAPR